MDTWLHTERTTDLFGEIPAVGTLQRHVPTRGAIPCEPAGNENKISSLIRYPGSKHKIRDRIISSFPPNIRFGLWNAVSKWEYVEPFFGSGAIGWEIIAQLPPGARVTIADKDYWLNCLWKSILDCPSELSERVARFVPSTEWFYLFKQQDGDTSIDPCEAGFRKLALHQMSFSGLGVMAGGPLGGRSQGSNYSCDCRWNPDAIICTIEHRHRLLRAFSSVNIKTQDFAAIITTTPVDAFIYCDPPYVDKGPELYRHSFTEQDHIRLRRTLCESKTEWAVSYDDHPLVRSLYAGCRFVPIDLVYSCGNSDGKRRKNREVLIFKH